MFPSTIVAFFKHLTGATFLPIFYFVYLFDLPSVMQSTSTCEIVNSLKSTTSFETYSKIYIIIYICFQRFLRATSYRECSQLIHGHLDGGRRIPLPACAIHAIRSTFDIEDGGNDFTG